MQAWASIIVTHFQSQSCLNIFHISFFNCPYISFLLNLGAKTIWYLQLYFVCDKLLLSIIWILILSIKFGCEPFLIIDKRSFLYPHRLSYSEHTCTAYSINLYKKSLYNLRDLNKYLYKILFCRLPAKVIITVLIYIILY